MTKKTKDFFESILSDVTPLSKKKYKTTFFSTTDDSSKKDKQKNLLGRKEKPTEISQKSLKQTKHNKLSQKKQNTETNQNSKALKKLKRGKINIDKTIDLHGYKLHEAEEKFNDELQKSYLLGLRCILFITGKGLMSKKHDETRSKLYYGSIREKIQNWSKNPLNASKILYFSVAHSSHGGDGSFYVYLRKKK